MSKSAKQAPPLIPLFRTGQVVATPGALRTLQAAGVNPMDLLTRHVHGDWGDLCEEDKRQNEIAVATGQTRVFSSYCIGIGLTEAKVWLITEWDRSVTTLLLPSEY